jgi:hypothetical protein
MKYPRTFHLPWSPGGTKDDKKMKSVDSLLNREIIISEKLDGSNSCFETSGVFARSHGQAPKHASFDLLKQKYYNLQNFIKPDEQIFLENCFAVHSITYEELSDFCFVLNIREKNLWLSQEQVEQRARELNLKSAPVLFKGTIKSSLELEKLTSHLSSLPSIYGGEREGVVVRVSDSFLDKDFSHCVAKWVRKDHVQTDEHWMNKAIVKQKFKNKP